ncbi:MAG TPA: hypothetical protein VK610_07745 [Rhodothermales bacterium]|nr:hypothetical protein [Rhodothermales bacterium]
MDTWHDVGVVAVPTIVSAPTPESVTVTLFVNEGKHVKAFPYTMDWNGSAPLAERLRVVPGTVRQLTEHPTVLVREATSVLDGALTVDPESTDRLFTLLGQGALPGYFAAAVDIATNAASPGVSLTMRLAPRYRAAWRPPATRPGRAARRQDLVWALDERFIDATLFYLEEAYLAAPLLAAAHLRRVRRYDAAVEWLRAIYDDTATANARYIYPPLMADAGVTSPPKGLPVLNDPLDPVARMREVRGATLRHVLSALGRALLDGAEAEFARDTPEAVDLARARYERAEAVLAHPVLGGAREQSEEAGEVLEAFMRGSVAESTPELMPAYAGFLGRIRALPTVEARAAAAAAVVPELEATGTAVHLRMRGAALALVNAAQPTVPATLGELFTARKTVLAAARRAVETVGAVADRLEAVGRRVSLTASAPGGGAAPERVRVATAPPIGFTIPPNPVVHGLRLRATVGLDKIRHGLNASGIERPLHLRETTLVIGGAAGAAVRFQPTAYRAAVVLERARQHAVLAQQAEAAFLSALERYDAEAYAALQARQQLDLTLAGVQLQNLRVVEANDGERLAAGQIERSAFQQRHFSGLIARGISDTEYDSMAELRSSIDFHQEAMSFMRPQGGTTLSNLLGMVSGGFSGAIGGRNMSFLPGLGMAIGGALGILGANDARKRADNATNASRASTQASIASTRSSLTAQMASYERRAEDWGLQSGLAQQDVALGRLGLTLARDRTAIVRMERSIAVLQANHAAETVAFLATKFTSAELYLWMSGVLEDIFVFYLQLATATARLALDQLAFERQVAAPPLIAADYYEAPGGNGEDRRGITGSARLQADLARLDQYAFETDRRKLQLVRTVSLAQHDPIAFARFRETGVLPFSLPMETFDREFPGHYLRLVRSASVTVVGLIPPVQGIRASLASSGMSTVVVDEDGVFRPVRVRRDPDEVALSSPYAASGVFQLEAEGQLRLLPFEGGGVDARWEFRLPRPANPFDFASLADVLVSVEYSALRSDVYETEVIGRLDPVLRADRPFSLRDDFADAWYDLLNPGLGEEEGFAPGAPLGPVSFTTRREDFPPHLTELRIEHVLLYAVRAPGEEAVELEVEEFVVNPGPEASPTGEETVFDGLTTKQGLLSTRHDGTGWGALDVPEDDGGALTWSLTLSHEAYALFEAEKIEDILVVLVFEGLTPPWPL